MRIRKAPSICRHRVSRGTSHRECRGFPLALLLIVTAVMACSGPQVAVSKHQPTVGQRAVMPPGEMLPPTMNIADEILGVMISSSIDTILQQGTAYVLPHLPPPLQPLAQPESIKMQFFKSIKEEGLEQALDTTRPWGLALADPEVYRGAEGLGPLLLAVPVRNPDEVIAFLTKKTSKHEVTPGKDHLFAEEGGKSFMVRFQSGWAFVASHEKLLYGAADILLPRVKSPPEHSLAVLVNMSTIAARYKKQIEQGLAQMQEALDKGEVEESKSSLARMAMRWLGYARSIGTINVMLDLKTSEILTRVEAIATGQGSFSTYLANLDVGPPWGAKYLPQDSVLIGLGRQNEKKMAVDVEENMQIIQAMLKDIIEEKTLSRWREVLLSSIKHYTGESAVALWVNGDGGVGVGLAYGVKDGPQARAAWLKVMQLAGQELQRLLLTTLKKELKAELPGFNLKLVVRPNALRVAGVKGDRVELVVTWPKLETKEERQKMETLRKGITKVLGPRLTMCFLTIGDVGFTTIGRDCQKRLAGMAAVAKGGTASKMEQTVASIVGNKKSVSVFYSPLASLTEGIFRVVDQITTLPAAVQEVVHKSMPGPGKDVPASGLLHLQSPDRLIFDLSLSPDLVGMIAKAAMQIPAMTGLQP